MALSVKIKTNSKAIERRYKRLKSKFPSIIDKGILQAGFQLLDIIRTKTAKGIDINSSKFAPYSTSYLKKLNSFPCWANLKLCRSINAKWKIS